MSLYSGIDRLKTGVKRKNGERWMKQLQALTAQFLARTIDEGFHPSNLGAEEFAENKQSACFRSSVNAGS